MKFALLLFLAISVTTSAFTWAVRRYTVAKSILDIPNHRSSHTVPTPRGGGLAIAATVLGALVVGGVVGVVPRQVALALAGGGGLIALIGWVDDNRGVPARWRAAVHFLAAGWALFWLGGFPALNVGWASLHLGLAGTVLAAVGIVWLTNLYNFMDGIDGIAAGEALTVGLASGAMLLASGRAGLGLVSVIIAAAALGFLVWNWAPAKIFMGDVGSGMLGYLFAVLAVASENTGALPLLVWVVLLGAFIFDATVTLLRRVARGERWYDAHRSHAYQRAVRIGGSHARVTGSVLVINSILALIGLAGWVWPSWLLAWFFVALVGLATAYLLIEHRNPMGAPSVTRGLACTTDGD